MEKSVIIEIEGRVTVITLNRPAVLNSFSNQLLTELTDAMYRVSNDNNIAVVIITGAGRSFCAGGSLDVLMDISTTEQAKDIILCANMAIESVYKCKKPVIAMVNGYAAGAGFNLALACDLIFADENAKFIQAFVNVGLASNSGGHWLLSRQVGPYIAKELMFTAMPVTAQEGQKLGFVNRIYQQDILRRETLDFAASLVQKPPMAISVIKKLINRSQTSTLQEILESEAEEQPDLILSNDCKEGILAFYEKRPAHFTGK